MAVSDQELAERRERIENSLASVRLKGLEPSDAAKAIFERYAAGEISMEEMGVQIQALNGRE